MRGGSALSLLLLSGLPGQPREWQETSAWRFLPSASIAYDSFGQRYVIADEDTLDLVQETSGRLCTALERRGRTEFSLRNTLGIGEQATRDDLELRLRRQIGTAELQIAADWRWKAYRSQSAYVLSSDYQLAALHPQFSWRLFPEWRLRVEDRSEWAHFARRTRYNYDYSVHDAGATVERSYGLLSLLGLGYTHGRRSVPDSTQIDYRRHLLLCDWSHEAGAHTVRLDQRLERRLYADPRVRSHFLEFDAGLGLRLALRPQLRLRPEYRADLLRYDTPDSVYSSYSEQAFEVLLERDFGDRTTFALGPRAEFRRTSSTIDRAYDQWGLKGSVSFLSGTRLWVEFSDEVGVRRHLAGEDLFFSDYVFNWSTLYLSCELWPGLAFDLFFSLDPENHTIHADDTTTILVSTSLTYGWR